MLASVSDINGYDLSLRRKKGRQFDCEHCSAVQYIAMGTYNFNNAASPRNGG